MNFADADVVQLRTLRESIWASSEYIVPLPPEAHAHTQTHADAHATTLHKHPSMRVWQRAHTHTITNMRTHKHARARAHASPARPSLSRLSAIVPSRHHRSGTARPRKSHFQHDLKVDTDKHKTSFNVLLAKMVSALRRRRRTDRAQLQGAGAGRSQGHTCPAADNANTHTDSRTDGAHPCAALRL